MLASTQKYYVLGGKGGAGKTSMAASLAVKFANRGEPTLIVSTDPTRSLGDSVEQDMSDGKIVHIDGFDSLFAVEVDMSKLDQLLNRVPPGFEEAFAILMVINAELQGKFRRIVLDTTIFSGHTLKLLLATDWIEKFLGLTIKAVNTASSLPLLKSKLEKEQIDSSRQEELLGELRQQTARVHELLYDPQSTEFIIVTIPTMMAVIESSRFHASLKKDGVHTRRLVVNQVLLPSASDCRICAAKRREQARAFSAIRDGELGGLKLIQAPLLDVEVEGVPALRFLSDSVWK